MQLPFWSSLTERERETVQRSAVTRRYEKGALIHDGGSECLGLVLVLSGVKAKLFCPEIAGLFCRIAGLFCHDSRANLSLKPVCFGIAIS